MPTVGIDIRQKPPDNRQETTYPPGSGFVKVTGEENPESSGFWKFTHGPPSGVGSFKVKKVEYGDAQEITVDLGITPGDNIQHLADGNFIYSYNKGGNSWQPLSGNPRNNPLTGKTLETQLDGLNCKLNDAVTINPTFQNSEVHKNNESYCCAYHNPTGNSGRVSVTIKKVSCKQNHRSADYYRHKINTVNGLRVAAIKYDPTGGSTRNRINLNGQPMSSVETIYVLYCSRNPKLIYVDGGAATGWYKKPIGNDKVEQWTETLPDLKGVTPEDIIECTNWSKLKDALKEAKCGNFGTCPPPPPQQPRTPPGPAASPSGTVVDPTVSLLGTLLRGALSGLGKVASNKQLLENLVDFGKSGSDFVSKTGIDTIGAALASKLGIEALRTILGPPHQHSGPSYQDTASTPDPAPPTSQAFTGAEPFAFATLGYALSGTLAGSAAAFFGGWKVYSRYKGDPLVLLRITSSKWVPNRLFSIMVSL
ncbi:hypothetical protein BEWA_027730 [Theileria equi strain WA]|uniref:Uncharacterized protein n=1 Tax=Theileria equi strain WA TaxID=1537102 RepID=L0AYH2_THEEQ|nr:hypothetical protein BEWA_027730 [Theileria equi strain WA]AFZ79924.1 hypothetical protein BEWA_027730 [Theileria equi strain WA]|eukprot:XP_004829590.1 hypothetical protein BEWA_027730 [Theileria equi strain WA]